MRLTLAIVACSLLSRTCGRLTLPGRPQLHSGATRLRQADGNRLFRRSCAVLAFTDVLDLLVHELTSLRRRRLSLTSCFPGTRNRPFLRHGASRKMLEDAWRLPATKKAGAGRPGPGGPGLQKERPGLKPRPNSQTRDEVTRVSPEERRRGRRPAASPSPAPACRCPVRSTPSARSRWCRRPCR